MHMITKLGHVTYYGHKVLKIFKNGYQYDKTVKNINLLRFTFVQINPQKIDHPHTFSAK